jgi:uncharacterized protein
MTQALCTDILPDLNDGPALFNWGVACSLGVDGMELDLIEAHKWFNLAALAGDDRGVSSRTDIALTLTPCDVREAQRRARSLLH